MEDNNPKAVMSKLVPGLMKMSDLFTLHKNFVPGDMIVMDCARTGLVGRSRQGETGAFQRA